MELTVLGMNGPFPAANGATSGYLMRGEKTRMAMDMGSGTLGRLTALMPPGEAGCAAALALALRSLQRRAAALVPLAGVRGKTAGCLRAGG